MFNIDALRLEIESMLRDHPDLADDEVLRLDMLEGETDIKEVLTELGRRLAATKALEKGLRSYIEELLAREDRFKIHEDRLRKLMFKVLDSAQIKKISLPELTLSLKSNPQRLLGDADPNTMPDRLVHIKRSVDRTKVREAIEDGEVVPGFTLSNAAPSLVVKVR